MWSTSWCIFFNPCYKLFPFNSLSVLCTNQYSSHSPKLPRCIGSFLKIIYRRNQQSVWLSCISILTTCSICSFSTVSTNGPVSKRHGSGDTAIKTLPEMWINCDVFSHESWITGSNFFFLPLFFFKPWLSLDSLVIFSLAGRYGVWRKSGGFFRRRRNCALCW